MGNVAAQKVESDQPVHVAIDNGYADHKVAYWVNKDGKRTIEEVLLPSRAQMGAINISLDGKSSGVYTIDGDNWTVSKDVTEPESIRGQKYAYSDLNTVLVNHSLISAGFSDRSVKIATGLPFDHYFKSGELNTLLLDKVKEALKTNVAPKSEHNTAIISGHVIFPESTAAFADYAMNEDGELIHQLEIGAAVVDVGGNTTDITYINPDNTMNRQKSGSRQLGVLNVRDRLRQLIQENFSIDQLRDSQLDTALRTGVCSIFGKNQDVSNQIETAKRESVKKLMNFVEEKVGDASDLDFVLFVGGGAEVLAEVIKEYPHAIVPERPQFANARGMLKYMSMQDS